MVLSIGIMKVSVTLVNPWQSIRVLPVPLDIIDEKFHVLATVGEVDLAYD